MGDVFSQEWKNPQEAFEYIDVNGDGGVDFGEIKAALSDIVHPAKLRKMFHEFDDDGNGELDLEEFTRFMLKLGVHFTDFDLASASTAASLRTPREVFDELDADGSGSIDRAEMRAALRALRLAPAEAEIERLFAQCDADGSDEIEFG